MCIYIYIERERKVYAYIYIYIEREREKEKVMYSELRICSWRPAVSWSRPRRRSAGGHKSDNNDSYDVRLKTIM